MSKVKRIAAVLLSAVMLVSGLTVSASAEKAQALKNGVKTTVEVKMGNTLTYEFSIAEESDFVLDLKMEKNAWGMVNVYDKSTGDVVIPESMPTTNGTSGYDDKVKTTRLW